MDHIYSIAVKLRKQIKPLPPPPHLELMKWFRKHDAAEMVRVIRDHLNMPDRFTVAYVRSGGCDALAWIHTRVNSDDPNFTIFIRREMFRNFESCVLALAHEITHAYLYKKIPDHWRDERFVDVATMMLGFHEYYLKGQIFVTKEYLPQPWWKKLFQLFCGYRLIKKSTYTLSSLTPAEVEKIHKLVNS